MYLFIYPSIYLSIFAYNNACINTQHVHLHVTLNSVCGVPAAAKVFPVPGQLVQQHPDRCFSGCLETRLDEKRACLILCFVNLLFFCCGKKGTWLEHGRIFSIKKIIYIATRSVLKCGCRCHPNQILFVHFNHPAVMSTVKGHVWSIFPFTPPKRAASNTRWPMASTVQELHHTNWWIPMETLRTTYKYQFRSLILHVHTTSENPQLWALSHIGLSQKLTFAQLLQYFVWDIQVNQGKHRWHLTLKNRYQWDPAAWEDRPMAAPSKRSPAELFNNTVAYHGSEGADGLA